MALKVKQLKRGTNQITVVDQQIQVGEVKRGNATIKRWIDAVQSAERLTNPDRRSLLDIYRDISIDGHLRSVVDKRVRAVSTQPFVWEDLADEKIIENFQSPWFYNLQRQMMNYVFEGHQVIELMLGEDGLIADTEPVPRQNVRPELQKITWQMYGFEGFSYVEEPTCDYILEIGKPKDLGLYQHMAPYVLMKRDNLAFWMTFNELFGMPMRVYYYNPNDKTSRQQTIEQAKSQGAAAWVVLPESSRMEFANAQASSASSNGAYNALHDTLNKEITITALGQTLTTDANGKGSYALGGIHKAVEEGVNLEDMLWMEYMLNYKFKPLAVKHGYPLKNIKGHYERTEAVSMEQKKEIWAAVAQHAPIADEDWYAEFGVPSPEDRLVSLPPDASRKDPEPEPPAGGAQKKKLNAKIRKMYAAAPIAELSDSLGHLGRKELTLAAQSRLEKIIERVIRQLYDRELTAGQVDQELFEELGAELYKGAERGFKDKLSKLTPGTVEYDLLLKLREDVYVFSGFKSYQMLQEASKLLINDLGEIRAFAEFRDLVLQVHEQYNVNWLLTEYNMAVANTDMARKWLHIEEQKDTLPWLSFSSVKDERARHTAYDGITRKVDDPVWNYLTPPLDWGCRCSLRQLADGKETHPNDMPGEANIKGEFAFNPGKQKVVFPKNHPYYVVDAADQKRANSLFGLEIPKV